MYVNFCVNLDHNVLIGSMRKKIHEFQSRILRLELENNF